MLLLVTFLFYSIFDINFMPQHFSILTFNNLDFFFAFFVLFDACLLHCMLTVFDYCSDCVSVVLSIFFLLLKTSSSLRFFLALYFYSMIWIEAEKRCFFLSLRAEQSEKRSYWKILPIIVTLEKIAVRSCLEIRILETKQYEENFFFFDIVFIKFSFFFQSEVNFIDQVIHNIITTPYSLTKHSWKKCLLFEFCSSG